MDSTLSFLADERVRQLRHDADLVRAGRHHHHSTGRAGLRRYLRRSR
jgi:hypothetical protein